MLTRNADQGLAHRERVKRFVAGESNVSIVHIRLAQAALQEKKQRVTSLNTAVEGMLNAVRHALRGGDVLFEFAEYEYVVVLTQTDSAAASGVASRITELLGEARPDLFASLQPAIGVACAPADGRSLAALVEVARERHWQPTAHPPVRPPAVH
jgi:hypothetical protein